MLALRDWQNFYILTGTAAATLIGLLFVAISIGTHLPEKRVNEALRTFVNPILTEYVQVLLLSCLMLMPPQNTLFLGSVLIVMSGVNIFGPLKICWRMLVLHKDDHFDLRHWLWHFLLPLIAGTLFLYAAIGFLRNLQLATLSLAITDMLCLAIGLHNSWVLTIWLVLHRDRVGNMGGAENPLNRTDFAGSVDEKAL